MYFHIFNSIDYVAFELKKFMKYYFQILLLIIIILVKVTFLINNTSLDLRQYIRLSVVKVLFPLPDNG